MLLILVNETTIYSALQNLPYTTRIGSYGAQSQFVIATLAAGKYEIKISGQMIPNATTGERQIAIGSFPILAWNNSADAPTIQNQAVLLEVNLTQTTQILGLRPGTIDAPPVAYQVAYRSTPSLELITKSELDQKNQEIIENQEQKWDKEYYAALDAVVNGGG